MTLVNEPAAKHRSPTAGELPAGSPDYPCGGAIDHGVVYPLHVHQFGPRWRDTRPPGYPEWVPHCGGPGSGYLMIDRWCEEQGAPGAFRDAMRDLARTESYGGCLFLPGNPYDGRLPGKSSKVRRFGNEFDGNLPRGATFSTAAGAFQWRGDTWETGLRQLGYPGNTPIESCEPDDGMTAAGVMRPWEATAWGQMAYPLEYYWRLLWQPVAHHGERWGFLLCRLWHRLPGLAKRVRQAMAKNGADPARVWALVSPAERAHLEMRWRTRSPDHDIVVPGSGVVDWDLASARWIKPFEARDR